MSRIVLSLCVATSVGCAVFGSLWYGAEKRLQKLRSEVNRSDDAPYEKLAIEALARHEGITADGVKGFLHPITITFPDRRCVELRPKWGVAGGTTIYCFSEGSMRPIAHYQIGE